MPSTSAAGKESSVLVSNPLVLGSQGHPRNILHIKRVEFLISSNKAKKKRKAFGAGTQGEALPHDSSGTLGQALVRNFLAHLKLHINNARLTLPPRIVKRIQWDRGYENYSTHSKCLLYSN